jgi:tetratricopeptide (TPR) repeat protein
VIQKLRVGSGRSKMTAKSRFMSRFAAVSGFGLVLASGFGPGLARAGVVPPEWQAQARIEQIANGWVHASLAQAAPAEGSRGSGAASGSPAAASAGPAVDPRLPRIELGRQVMFQYLLAEIAAQRGRFDIATSALNDLARSTRDPRIAQRATEIALRAGAYQPAVDAAGIWISIDPDSIQARQTMVALLVNGGQLPAAVPHLERLLVNEGDNIGRGFLQLGALFAKQSDRAVVLGVVRELAARHPGLREARLAVAQAAWTAKDFNLALSEVREAQRISPDWELAALFETQILARRSNAEAMAQLERFVAANPGATEARMNLARLYSTEQRLPEARREFQRLAADFPDNAELGMAIGLLSLQLGDFDTADQQLRKLLAGQPKDPDTLRYYLGRAAEGRKQLPDALEWYRSVGAGQQRVPAQLAQATVLARQGRTKEAREVLRQIVPSSLDQRVQLVLTESQVLRDARDFQGAFDVLGEALARTPDTADLLYDQALVAERLGRFDITEKNLTRVIEIRPDHAHAHNALGYTLADRNVRLDEALKLIETALRLAPEDPYIMDSMGWVFFRMGDSRKALSFLQRAYTLKRDAEIAAHLGEVLWTLGQRDEARRIWVEALKSSPDNEVLQGTVKRLLD